nr:hypothetical protein [Tanacetum cinerariifolium]
MIHSKVIYLDVLDSWQRDIIVTLCELEMYFPPSFFDIMVHLASHILSEIKAGGPIHLHYMFPFKRYMGIVKGYLRNRSRPEGSIVEGYTSEEVIDFYTNYLEGVKGIGVPQSHYVGRLHGHMEMLRVENIGRTKTWYTKRHNEQFATWLKDKVAENIGQPNINRIVERLGEEPRFPVKTYKGYEINGYSFYTKTKDEKGTVANSGVTVRWNISNDDAKKTMHKKANEIFSRFKSNLTQQFIVKKNNNPKATYGVVNMIRWDEFFVSHESEEFKAITENVTKIVTAAFQDKFDSQKSEMEGLKAIMAHIKGRESLNCLDSSCASDEFDDLEDPAPCDLLWPYGPEEFLVATGKVYPTRDATLHGSFMFEGHIKVQVDTVDDAYKAIPLSKQTDKAQNLE